MRLSVYRRPGSHRHKMKVFVLLALASGCLAATAQSPPKQQGALLVVPLKQENSTNTTNTTTPSPADTTTENLEDVNAKLMERLAQEDGAQKGVYHIYLQDGTLQKVQYTATPIKPQQEQTSANNAQQQQTPEILRPDFADKRGVYFVQIPKERIKNIQSQNEQSQQVSSQKQEYVPEQPNVPIVRYLPIILGEADNKQQQQEEPAGYYASVQYSPVQPIQGPVYSYKPEGLTRILRYAPVY